MKMASGLIVRVPVSLDHGVMFNAYYFLRLQLACVVGRHCECTPHLSAPEGMDINCFGSEVFSYACFCSVLEIHDNC